jgi:hypothetical protein
MDPTSAEGSWKGLENGLGAGKALVSGSKVDKGKGKEKERE